MKAKKKTPGQKSLWDEWQAPMDAVQNVAKKFVLVGHFSRLSPFLGKPSQESPCYLGALDFQQWQCSKQMAH
jgi:hypothetical protein